MQERKKVTFFRHTGYYGKLVDKFCQIKVWNFFRVVPKSRKIRIKDSAGIIFFNPPRYRKVIFYMGTGLLLSAVGYFFYLYFPLISAIYKYKSANVEDSAAMMAIEAGKAPENSDYIIEIPKILAYSKVVENVSPFDSAEYNRVLKNGVVAQAKGTAIPGESLGKSTYIFAHSTNEAMGNVRNNAVFYLLGELKKDDMIFINYHGKYMKYKVFDRKIIKAEEIEYLNYSEADKNILILQTCWPIGTNWNRLLIFSELVI